MFGSDYLKNFGIEPFPFSNVDSQGGMFGAAFGFAVQPPFDPTAQQQGAPQPGVPGAQEAPAPLTSGAPIAPTATAIPGRRTVAALGAPPGTLGGSVLAPVAEQPANRAPAAGVGGQFGVPEV